MLAVSELVVSDWLVDYSHNLCAYQRGDFVFTSPHFTNDAPFDINQYVALISALVTHVHVLQNFTLGYAQCAGVPVCKYAIGVAWEDGFQEVRVRPIGCQIVYRNEIETVAQDRPTANIATPHCGALFIPEVRADSSQRKVVVQG